MVLSQSFTLKMDNFSKSSSESWFSRIGHSAKGTIGGILIFVISIVILWWNEGRAVKTARGLEEGIDNVVVLEAPELDDKNNNKLIHFHGPIITEDSLYDVEFNIAVKAVKLTRNIEMYQWKETSKSTSQKKTGGGKETITEYKYSKEWSSSLIDSDNFEEQIGHQNPSSMPYSDFKTEATNIYIGDFSLSKSVLAKINNFQPISVKTPAQYKDKNSSKTQSIFVGQGTTGNPSIGDVRISFKAVPLSDYSIIAQQSSGILKPYKTSEDTEILLTEPGEVSADEMFQDALSANTTLTWIFRILGFVMMFAGLSMMVQIIETIADVIQIIGTITGLGIKIFAGVISFFVSMTIIGIAWIYYRPLLGGILIAIGLGIALIFYKKSLNESRT